MPTLLTDLHSLGINFVITELMLIHETKEMLRNSFQLLHLLLLPVESPLAGESNLSVIGRHPTYRLQWHVKKQG